MHKLGAIVAAGLWAAFLPAKTAKAPKKPASDYTAFHKKLTKEDQALHALDRLTFGPRAGDLEAVEKMGVKKWVDLQLHPNRIKENPELALRLDPLESLRFSQAEAASHYPTPQMIRAIAAGRQKMPDDPALRSAIERQMRRLKIKKNENGGEETMEPVKTLQDVLSGDQIRTLRNGTPDQKREFLANYSGDQAEDLAVALPPGLRNQLMPFAAPEMRRMMLLATAPQQVVAYDLSEAKLYRAILSNRQLEEELVDFWYNHFNVFLDKGSDRFMVPSYERDAIRPHVLGHFRDLLEATATSPAMMFYLDNWQSVGPQPPPRGARANNKRPQRGLNENYGRELMELHTLGVDGGYTQKDVTEVARCFTGWTIKNPNQGGGFTYNDRVHDKGAKVVLGVTIPAGGGREDGEKVLDILANHPATAHFISKELAQRFVADDPPPALIDKMAKKFLATHGDIREVMKVMLTSKEFWSEGAYRAKVKTPFEMIVSAVRATGAQVDYAMPLANQIAQLGEPFYRKLEPTGYSNANAEWVSSSALLARMNFALALAQNKFPGVKIDPARFKGEDPALVARQLMFTDATIQTRDAIAKALDQQKTAASEPALAAGLMLGSPDFQRR